MSFGFSGLADTVYAVEEAGEIVSARVSVKQNGACAEAWVLTAPQHRGRGLAKTAVTAWAKGILTAGLVPFYSHKKANLASAALTVKLGLVFVFEEITVIRAS